MVTNGWMRALLGVVSLTLFGLGSTAPPIHAQNASAEASDEAGTIVGTVMDAKEGAPLPGANVTIQGTTTGTSTDLNGRYRLDGLDPGTYDVLVSFVGFQQKTITGVEVTAGDVTTLDVSLREETEQLEEVIVSAEAARDSEAGLLKQRAKAAAVSDAISAEAMGRAGSGTAADAMSKVTGASVVEGKFVNVRGLQGRYVNAQLNGSNLPSADPDGNSVALDLFPSNLLDNIVTTKTFTPDRPGNITGGSIDISTKSFPEDLFAKASVSTSFNSEVGIGGEVLRPVGGLESVPTAADREELPSTLAQTFNDPEKRQALEALTQAFATPVSPGYKEIVGNRSAEVSVGNQFSVLNGRSLGFIASFSYDESFSGYNDGSTARFEQTGSLSQTLNPTADYTTQRGVQETLMGGLVGLSFQPTSQHELSLRLLYNGDHEEEARIETGRLPRDLTDNQLFQTRVMRTTERSVTSAELKGSHQLGSGQEGIRVEWTSTLSEIIRDEPDYRFFSNHFSSDGDDTTYAIAQAVYPVPARFFRNLTEQDWSGRVSVEVPLGPATLTTGGRVRSKAREFRERRFDHLSDQADFRGNPDVYVNDQAGVDGEDAQGRNRFGTYVLDQTQARNNYDGDQQIGAGFLMAEMPVPGVPALEFVGGVRLEYTDMSIATLGGDDAHQGQFTELDLLPSGNLVWALQENMNLRLAYGRTVARPSFREFAPFESFNFVGDYLEVGNPDLNRTRVDNFDVRWEWFMNRGELLSASAYYKDFTDPIERTIDPRAAANEKVTYKNRSDARVYGVELEARKRLGSLASWLEHVQVGGNLTLAHSEVSRTDEVLEAIRAYDDSPSDTRPLQGQSPYLLNLNAGYENPALGTSVNVFFHRFGDRLQTVARNGVDLFEQGRSSLDVNVSQQILRRTEIKASVKNVLDQDEVVAQTFRGQSFVNDRRPLGRTVSIGLSYSF